LLQEAARTEDFQEQKKQKTVPADGPGAAAAAGGGPGKGPDSDEDDEVVKEASASAAASTDGGDDEAAAQAAEPTGRQTWRQSIVASGTPGYSDLDGQWLDCQRKERADKLVQQCSNAEWAKPDHQWFNASLLLGHAFVLEVEVITVSNSE